MSISSFGQKIRFTDSTNAWSIVYKSVTLHLSSNTFTQSFNGNIIIDGNVYVVIGNSGYASYIREDTLANKVYFRRHWTDINDTVDILLYNYNWKLGDTVKYGTDANRIYWIDKIDSTEINSIWYKVWHLKGCYSYTPSLDFIHFYVIEGIGCTSGFDALVNWEFGYFYRLLCFTNSGNSYPLSNPAPTYLPPYMGYDNSMNFDNNTSCNGLGIEQVNSNNNTSSLFPNPIDKTSKIIFPYNITSGKITVANDIGQTILSTTFQNKEELLIGDKIHTPGMYFYHVIDNQNGDIFSGKFVSR